jgi:hypothetical protein
LGVRGNEFDADERAEVGGGLRGVKGERADGTFDVGRTMDAFAEQRRVDD